MIKTKVWVANIQIIVITDKNIILKKVIIKYTIKTW